MPPSLYLGETRHTGWFRPTCPHGSTEWEGASPQCEDPACMRRWALRWGVPVLLIIAGILVLALTVFREPWPDCGPGGEHLGRDTCVYR